MVSRIYAWIFTWLYQILWSFVPACLKLFQWLTIYIVKQKVKRYNLYTLTNLLSKHRKTFCTTECFHPREVPNKIPFLESWKKIKRRDSSQTETRRRIPENIKYHRFRGTQSVQIMSKADQKRGTWLHNNMARHKRKPATVSVIAYWLINNRSTSTNWCLVATG